MPGKILKLFFVFIVLFSLSGYSQTKKNTDHPLLDKYYPRAEKDTSAAITAAPPPVPQSVQPPVIKPVPPAPPVLAPIVTTTVTDPITTAPLPRAKITPGITQIQDTLAITKTTPVNIPQPETTIDSETIPSSTVTDVAAATKPISAATTLPVQKIVQPRAPATPNMDMRLGSSTPAYDTWKKNNNGAGSVTTSAK